MELYNHLIKDTEELLKGTPKTWAYSESAKWKDLGVSELVLQKDAAYELGAQGKGSANFVLFTSSAELVSEDKVMLFGRDMGEICSDCDFARIVLLRIGVLDDDDEKVYRTLKDIEFAKYHVYPEGYMTRMSPESFREQIRVSKTALRKGISFKNIGMNYISEYKKDPNVIAASYSSPIPALTMASSRIWRRRRTISPARLLIFSKVCPPTAQYAPSRTCARRSKE